MCCRNHYVILRRARKPDVRISENASSIFGVKGTPFVNRGRLRRLLIRHGYAVPPSLTREGIGLAVGGAQGGVNPSFFDFAREALATRGRVCYNVW